MEQDFGLDLEEVCKVIDTADVVIVRFKIVDQRVLIDARPDEIDGPMIRLVSRAQSVEDRFRSLKELRPRLPLPDKIMGFEWPKHVAVLADAGIWQRVETRMEASGGAAAKQQVAGVYQQLIAAERREEIAAIRGGDGYQTLWERN